MLLDVPTIKDCVIERAPFGALIRIRPYQVRFHACVCGQALSSGQGLSVHRESAHPAEYNTDKLAKIKISKDTW